MRFVLVAVLFLCSSGIFLPAPAQDQDAVQPQADQYFSGVIKKIEDGKITVTRTVLGKEDATRTFLITTETRIEGKPKVKSRVTVRYIASEDGDRAVHILVRK